MVSQKYRWDFIGLSTDTKPTSETSDKVVNGSTFYCSDTSKLYVYCDGTWYERKALGGGGGGGTSDYPDLTNKPKINNVELVGNKSLNDLGIVALDEFYKAFPTDTASGAVASFPDGAYDLPLKSLVVDIELVQGGSGDPSPTNIRPISGWNGVNVMRTGKNLFDVPASVTKGYITFTRDSDGYVTANPNNTDSRPWGKDNAQFLVNLAPGNYKLVIQLKTPSATQYSGWEIYSPTGVKIAGSSGGKFRTDEVADFTASESGNYYIMAKMHTSVSRFMVVKDGADTSNYEPYTGDTYSITFPAAAGTVYGGTLDVTTGVLTVDRAMVDLGAKNWYSSSAAGRTRFRASITDIERISSPNIVAPMLCSNYPTKSSNQTYQGITGVSLQQNEADIYIYDPQTQSMTTAEFKSAMSGVQLVYKLATPQTYQLTPTEVTTLLGDNTIWADTGNTEVEYRADTKLYINKMIGDAETISTRLASGGRETALYKGATNPIETNIPLEEGVE